jgi:hypothetical protein
MNPDLVAQRKKEERKELILSILIGIGVLAVLIFGVAKLFERNKPAGAEGVIIEKTHIPRNIDTVTFGADGVRAGKDKGDFILTVKLTALDRTLNVWVDERAYNSYKVGDRYYVVRLPRETEEDAATPPPAASATP